MRVEYTAHLQQGNAWDKRSTVFHFGLCLSGSAHLLFLSRSRGPHDPPKGPLQHEKDKKESFNVTACRADFHALARVPFQMDAKSCQRSSACVASRAARASRHRQSSMRTRKRHCHNGAQTFIATRIPAFLSKIHLKFRATSASRPLWSSRCVPCCYR